MTDLRTESFERILLIKPSSPGDIIHALPVLRGLRRRFPGAHLAWLVATPFVNLVEADPALDEVIPFDRKRFGRIGRSGGATRDFMAFLRDLRRKKFQLVVDLQGLVRSGFFSLACGAPIRIGFREAREFAWMFYNRRIARIDRDAHAVDKNYAVGELLGFDDAPLDLSVATTEDDRLHATALLTETGIVRGNDSETARYAVLVPTTRWETKCWPIERFGLLARLIKQRHGLPSVLVGGPADVDSGRRAADADPTGSAVNLCGRTTLRQLAAIIAGSSIVITADSTPMHMAAAHGRPLVALFGPTHPQRTGPYGRLHDVLKLGLECSPCYIRKLSQCPHDHACMRDLTVDRVAEAVAERLESSPAASIVGRTDRT